MAASFGAVALPWGAPACEPVPVCGRVAVLGGGRWPLLWIEGKPEVAVCAVWAKSGSVGGFAASVGEASVGAFAASVGAFAACCGAFVACCGAFVACWGVFVACCGAFVACCGAFVASVDALGVGSGI